MKPHCGAVMLAVFWHSVLFLMKWRWDCVDVIRKGTTPPTVLRRRMSWD